MISIIIGLAIGIIVGLIILHYVYYTNDYVDIILFIFLMMGGLFGFFVAIRLPMDKYKKEYIYNIELSVNNEICFSSIKVKNQMNYCFYIQENGFYKLMQIDCNLAKIKYTEGNPKVYVYEICPSNAFINKFAIDFDIFEKTYVIEIPKKKTN